MEASKYGGRTLDVKDYLKDENIDPMKGPEPNVKPFSDWFEGYAKQHIDVVLTIDELIYFLIGSVEPQIVIEDVDARGLWSDGIWTVEEFLSKTRLEEEEETHWRLIEELS